MHGAPSQESCMNLPTIFFCKVSPCSPAFSLGTSTCRRMPSQPEPLSVTQWPEVSTGIHGLCERIGEIEQPKNAWIEIARQAPRIWPLQMWQHGTNLSPSQPTRSYFGGSLRSVRSHALLCCAACKILSHQGGQGSGSACRGKNRATSVAVVCCVVQVLCKSAGPH